MKLAGWGLNQLGFTMTVSEPVRLDGKTFLRSAESRILARVTPPNLSMGVPCSGGV
ncbi:MAG: hypothetical protein NWE88_05595 [Candidatus Bathyarchaeota archaeon]|nr:hypothetical protein [Candidatus Bathyarchaeota archaeon]